MLSKLLRQGCIVALVLTMMPSARGQQLDSISTLSVEPTTPAYNRKLNRFLTPSDTFRKDRFYYSAGALVGLGTGFGIGLYHAWYKNYPQTKFHTFDDRGEWLDMDKVGHGYTAYHYARWAYQGARWSGNSKSNSLLLGLGASVLLQSTIETLDGFSEQWGFSWYDMAANASGAGVFAAQEGLWGEQRINFKVSSWSVPYSTEPIAPTRGEGPPSTVAYRAAEQYGNTPWQRFIKDYNGQTIWVSTNPGVLLGLDRPPVPWLNLSFGYSAHNVLGAFGNMWAVNARGYSPPAGFERQREYVLSLDVDFERIPTRSPVLKTILHLANHFKFPAPALLMRQGESAQFDWLYY